MRLHTLVNDAVWLSRPTWLQRAKLPSDELTVKFKSKLHIEDPEGEMKNVKVLPQNSQQTEVPLFDIQKSSSLNKRLRVTDYIIHFTRNCRFKSGRKSGLIFSEELGGAENHWLIFFFKKRIFEKE